MPDEPVLAFVILDGEVKLSWSIYTQSDIDDFVASLLHLGVEDASDPYEVAVSPPPPELDELSLDTRLVLAALIHGEEIVA